MNKKKTITNEPKKPLVRIKKKRVQELLQLLMGSIKRM